MMIAMKVDALLQENADDDADLNLIEADDGGGDGGGASSSRAKRQYESDDDDDDDDDDNERDYKRRRKRSSPTEEARMLASAEATGRRCERTKACMVGEVEAEEMAVAVADEEAAMPAVAWVAVVGISIKCRAAARAAARAGTCRVRAAARAARAVVVARVGWVGWVGCRCSMARCRCIPDTCKVCWACTTWGQGEA